MPEHCVKDEPDPSPGPKINNPFPSAEPSPSPAVNPFAEPSFPISDDRRTNHSEPLWKVCDDRIRAKQVEINEEAVEHSRKYLEAAEKVLYEYRNEVHSCDTRLNEIGRSPFIFPSNLFYIILLAAQLLTNHSWN
jgi:hypothetical protein